MSGKPADDEVKLGDLKLKPNTKIMMMGTREESLVGNIIEFKFVFVSKSFQVVYIHMYITGYV